MQYRFLDLNWPNITFNDSLQSVQGKSVLVILNNFLNLSKIRYQFLSAFPWGIGSDNQIKGLLVMGGELRKPFKCH